MKIISFSYWCICGVRHLSRSETTTEEQAIAWHLASPIHNPFDYQPAIFPLEWYGGYTRKTMLSFDAIREWQQRPRPEDILRWEDDGGRIEGVQ